VDDIFDKKSFGLPSVSSQVCQSSSRTCASDVVWSRSIKVLYNACRCLLMISCSGKGSGIAWLWGGAFINKPEGVMHRIVWSP
jgi:hypothetical protein